MTRHSPDSVHKEIALQQHLVDQLLSGQGYEERAPEDYDRALAMDRELVLRFVKATQADEWAKLEAHYTASAEDEFFKNLEKALKSRGALDVFRSGLKMIPGIKFSLCYFKPASALEPKRVAEYEANILSVIQEVEYSQRHGGRIDVVLFVNGIPVATMELKNLLTGSTFKHAERRLQLSFQPASGTNGLAFLQSRHQGGRDLRTGHQETTPQHERDNRGWATN